MFKAHRLCASLNSRLEGNKEEEVTDSSQVHMLDFRYKLGDLKWERAQDHEVCATK